MTISNKPVANSFVDKASEMEIMDAKGLIPAWSL